MYFWQTNEMPFCRTHHFAYFISLKVCASRKIKIISKHIIHMKTLHVNTPHQSYKNMFKYMQSNPHFFVSVIYSFCIFLPCVITDHHQREGRREKTEGCWGCMLHICSHTGICASMSVSQSVSQSVSHDCFSFIK